MRELGPTPLIGFAGAPFTLASYLVEGGPSRDHARTKAMMYGEPALWHALLGRLAAIARRFLQVQIEAGVAAVQLFDSWAGALSRADYRTYVLPHSTAVLAPLADTGVPRIHFGVGTGELLDLMRAAGADVVGVDWRVPLDEAARRVGTGGRAAGQPGPGGPAGGLGRRAAGGPSCRREGVCRGRAHLQPWSRRAAADRSGRAARVVELVHSL